MTKKLDVKLEKEYFRPKILETRDYCYKCKQEFWKDDRSEDDIGKEYRIWWVRKEGKVVYERGCPNGHAWIHRKEDFSWTGRHRHPGLSEYHDATRKHQDKNVAHYTPPPEYPEEVKP